MVRKVVVNKDIEDLINLKGTISLCDTCQFRDSCDVESAVENIRVESYKKAPRHAFRYALWSCNLYRRKKPGRGRPMKTSNP